MSRIKQKFTKNSDGSENINLSCKVCGKPITKTNKFGMYCEDMCGLDEDKKAYEKIEKIMNGIFPEGFMKK